MTRQFGSLHLLPSGRWRASYTVPGRRWRTDSRTFATRLEAQQWLVSIKDHIITGRRMRRTSPFAHPTAEVAEALADAIEPRLRLAVLLAARCGLRLGEVLALQQSDRRGRADLVVGNTTIPFHAHIGPQPKTAASTRIVRMSEQICAEWDRHVKSHAGDRWLFATADGSRLRPNEAHRALALACDKAGVLRLDFHHLRHMVFAEPGTKDQRP
jgi:integrase